jgi:hypothetical protein
MATFRVHWRANDTPGIEVDADVVTSNGNFVQFIDQSSGTAVTVALVNGDDVLYVEGVTDPPAVRELAAPPVPDPGPGGQWAEGDPVPGATDTIPEHSPMAETAMEVEAPPMPRKHHKGRR